MSGFITLGSLTFLRVASVRRTGPARLVARALDYSRAAGLAAKYEKEMSSERTA